MNTRKIFFALLTMGILSGAACTSDNSEIYEQSVDKTKITKDNKGKESVDKTKITKDNKDKDSVDKTKITKDNKGNNN